MFILESDDEVEAKAHEDFFNDLKKMLKRLSTKIKYIDKSSIKIDKDYTIDDLPTCMSFRWTVDGKIIDWNFFYNYYGHPSGKPTLNIVLTSPIPNKPKGYFRTHYDKKFTGKNASVSFIEKVITNFINKGMP